MTPNQPVCETPTTDLITESSAHVHPAVLHVIVSGPDRGARDRLIGCLSENRLFGTEVRRRAGPAPDPSKKDYVDFSAVLDGISASGIDAVQVVFPAGPQQTTFLNPSLARAVTDGLTAVATVAVLIVDARKGVDTEAKRRSQLISRLAVEFLVVAVDNIEGVADPVGMFEGFSNDYLSFVKALGLKHVMVLPVCCSTGNNIVAPQNMEWFDGPTVTDYLASVVTARTVARESPFRMYVERVEGSEKQPSSIVGVIASGMATCLDRVRVQPAGKESIVVKMMRDGVEVDSVIAGQRVTLLLGDHVEGAAGDLVCAARSPAGVADQFETTLFWMHERPMYPGRTYLMKVGTKQLSASVTEIKHVVGVATGEHIAGKQLESMAIAECNISLERPVPFDAYAENRDTGCYILQDCKSLETVGVGLFNFALRRSQNIHVQHVDVDKRARSAIKHQAPCVLWFTGLSGAGKSTIANLLERKLHSMGYHTYLLDGDNVRHALNKDLGFTDADRVENIRRVAEVAKLMVDAGLIVSTAFISPFRAERQMARSLLERGEFIEVFVDTPLEVAEQRDVKGLYKKARRGEVKNFTGIDSPYEVPENPEFRMDTTTLSANDAAERVISYLRENRYIF